MKNEISVPENWNDIVFENRNKDYGAYFIRRIYFQNVVVAWAITLIIATLVFAYPSIARFLSGFERKEPIKEVKQTTVNLDQPPPIVPNQPPPPKIDVPPPVKTIIKFIPPKVTNKQIPEEEEMPTIEDLKKNETAPVAQEGNTEVIFQEPVQEEKDDGFDPNTIFMVVEQPPEFPGGLKALYEFIGNTIMYPAQARRMNVEGAVYVSFVVNADGKISDVSVMKGIGSGCDEEAVRVVKLLPPWKPGKQRGRPVKTRYTLPLKFTLG